MGYRILWRVPQQRLLQAARFTLAFEAGAIVLLVIALAQDALGLSAASIGIVLAGGGVGGLLTSTLVPSRLHARQWGPVLVTLFVVMALASVGLMAATGIVTAFLANAVLDGAVALAFVVAGATRQALTPDELLGRVGAASGLLNAFAATGGVFMAGLLISVLGERGAFGVFGAVFVVVGLGVLAASSARVPVSELRPVQPPE